MKAILSVLVLVALVLGACQPIMADSRGVPAIQQELDEATVTRALMPLPASLRDEAAIVAFDADWNRIVLREGTSDIACIAEAPLMGQYAVCQHVSSEPVWVYGMQLLMAGKTANEMDAIRNAAVADGTVQTPDMGATRYFLIGGREESLSALMVVHLPNATSATTGLSEEPSSYRPWLMFAGTPNAHIMIPGQ